MFERNNRHAEGMCEEPAYEYSIRVADTLKKYGYPQDVVVAGLLHDIIEDGGMTMKELDLGFRSVRFARRCVYSRFGDAK